MAELVAYYVVRGEGHIFSPAFESVEDARTWRNFAGLQVSDPLRIWRYTSYECTQEEIAEHHQAIAEGRRHFQGLEAFRQQ